MRKVFCGLPLRQAAGHFLFACLCYVCLCAFQVAVAAAAVSAAAAETSTEAFCFLILSVFANMLCDVYALFYAQFNVFLWLPVSCGFLWLPVCLCLPVSSCVCRFAYILEQYTEQYGIKYHKNSIKIPLHIRPLIAAGRYEEGYFCEVIQLSAAFCSNYCI